MKDIKSLYLTAKTSGRAEDISAYEECVKYLLENKPNDYISNLEYIISSSIGLKTWNEFVERYGLPIACYDNAIACFESCIEKCNNKEKDASVYTELKSRLESFRDNHIGCFMMYEYYSDLDSNKYVSTYYGFTESGVQNSKLLSGMIKKYGEAAVPDILINSEKMGAKVVTQALKFLENHETLNSPLFYQYLSEAVSNIDEGIIDNEIKGYIESIESKSASAIIAINKTRNQSVYRESIIMGEQDACVFAYTESELNAIQDMITFNEFKLTFLENTKDILKLQNEIYSLYEEFDGILEESGTANINDTIKKAFEDKVKNKLKNASVMKISDLDDWDSNPVDDKKKPNEPMKIVIFDEDVADSIVPMLPSANNGTLKTEAPYHVNTRNKKTGEVPAYLGNNHDLGYGEDDGKPLGSEDNDEPSLDDYRRKSIDNPKSNSVPEIQDIGGDIEDENSDKGNLQDKKDMSAINNYYYYTYNNSLNKNANSFNRDYSRRDDHSVSSTTHTTDDHSTNKGDNRGNSEVHNHYEKESSFNPCELDVPGNEKVFSEGKSIPLNEEVGDADDNKPVSDHPVKDVLTDIDRNLTKKQQAAKKAIQNVQNTGRIFIKPAVRTSQWINKMVMDWKDNDETKIKERMADPHARNNLFAAISAAIKAGSLAKAGLLFNPVFLFLTITRGLGRNKKLFRIRNEMIGEINTEIDIIKEKIRDADRAGDNKAKYQLMRLENELKKKLLRVGGGKDMKKII